MMIDLQRPVEFVRQRSWNICRPVYEATSPTGALTKPLNRERVWTSVGKRNDLGRRQLYCASDSDNVGAQTLLDLDPALERSAAAPEEIRNLKDFSTMSLPKWELNDLPSVDNGPDVKGKYEEIVRNGHKYCWSPLSPWTDSSR